MAWRNLQEFVAELERRGEIKRISAPVDPHLEIAEISDRVMKSGGPALLFEKVTDSTGLTANGQGIPLAINLFGTKARMELALGVKNLDDIAKRIEQLLEIPVPSGLLEKLSLLPKLAEMAQFPPKVVSRAPCQEVVVTDKPSLSMFPIIQCWPGDAGKYITLGATITRNKATGRRNVGLYRLQVFDDRTLGMHWQLHKDGAEHWRQASLEGARYPKMVPGTKCRWPLL